MRQMCWKCYRADKNCLCPYIRPFASTTRFIFLMHPMEARKEKMGTGRLCLAGLKNSKLYIGVDFSKDEELMKELANPAYQSALLYPSDKSIKIDQMGPGLQIDKPLQLIILDGTWPCAKKMMRVNGFLHELPHVSFNATKRSLFAIKQQPHELCLSSLETVHFVLDLLEQQELEKLCGQHHNLLEVFGKMVDFQIKCANDPDIPSYRHKGFRPPDERRPSIKWNKRKIFYSESNTL